MNVLVVDDNAIGRKLFLNLMRRYDAQIDEAEGGLRALEMVRQKSYDLIFLDYMMPDIDGIETYRRMKTMEGNLSKDAPVVALTANEEDGREMYLQAGFSDYLGKPVVLEELESIMGKYQGGALASNTVGSREPSQVVSKLDRFRKVTQLDLEKALEQLELESILIHMIEHFYSMMKQETQELQLFYQNIRRLNPESDEAAYTEALYQYQVKIHSMKSNAACIGATEVSQLAYDLEKTAAAKDGEKVLADTPLFVRKWAELYQALSQCMEN